MAPTEAAFAPAKVNLALHVTGRAATAITCSIRWSPLPMRRPADRATGRRAGLSVTGPMAAGVPAGADNLVLRAARLMGAEVRVTLDKQLPAAAGIGGGSSDAAACLRAVARLTGRPLPDAAALAKLGADLPVCVLARAARMRGIGEDVEELPALPPLPAVLVNPGVAVPTGAVFAALDRADNAPLPDRCRAGPMPGR